MIKTFTNVNDFKANLCANLKQIFSLSLNVTTKTSLKMLILIFVLLATLSLSNGNEFAGDLNTDTSTLNAHIHNGLFETRLDHFRPQFFDKVNFVSFKWKFVFHNLK